MVAPNGARRTHQHHSGIPLTDEALIKTVVDCRAAGADGAHLHIRDENGLHMIDATRYRILLEKLEQVVPDMYLQVTSEAAGIYESAQQISMMYALKPRYVSVALREIIRCDEDREAATSFYQWAASNNTEIHHILYSTEELNTFLTYIEQGVIPGSHHLLQFVLGNYDGSLVSNPDQVSLFTDRLKSADEGLSFDWMLCAFGKDETSCLVEAIKQGGKARIGFENSLYNADGSMAMYNAERVEELVSFL